MKVSRIDKLADNKKDNRVLKLKCMNREETIKVFDRFKEEKDGKMKINCIYR